MTISRLVSTLHACDNELSNYIPEEGTPAQGFLIKHGKKSIKNQDSLPHNFYFRAQVGKEGPLAQSQRAR